MTTLMHNLNAWRRGAGKPYLLYGRMVKPMPVSGDRDIPMVTPRDQQIHFRSVFTSRWTHGGKTVQFLVNYTPDSQKVTLNNLNRNTSLHLYENPSAAEGKVVTPAENGALELDLPALAAVMVEQ